MSTSAVRDLAMLLSSMEPRCDGTEWVFTTARSEPACPSVVTVVEDEGITAVVARSDADRLGLPYDYVAARVTLTVHSALDAVGLTAAVATALAREGISCNVVAGFFHDHLFVPHADRERAVRAVERLAQASGGAGGRGAPAGGATRG